MAESLQASEQRQRRLVADVAHELRTPLANLRGYLEALQDDVLHQTPELLASLQEEVLLQQRIVEDLQELTLAESGALTYHWADVDIEDLLCACVGGQHAQAEASGVLLDLAGVSQVGDITAGAGAVIVRGDADRLRQVVGNLVSNAVRAAGQGQRVELSARRDGETVRIEVRDTGCGIPADQLPLVFDRFWRADPARGRATGGSGLGLAIVRQIVLDHTGTVTASSEVGVGSTFTVTLPAAERGSGPR
jgi:two-component system sensor histidine kinase BaeS